MKVTPKTDDELYPVMPSGIYDAEVVKSEQKTSKSGNEMIALTLRVFANDGSAVLVNDWLLDSVPAKLKHFCDSAGLADLYEGGDLDAEACHGVSVGVKIKIDEGKDGYPPKNAVADYVGRPLPKNPPAVGTGKTASQVAAMNAVAATDDIPF